MKKILLIAAAMLAFAGCKEDEPVEPPVPQEPDEISVSPKSDKVGGEGGKVTTTVTSNGEWTLATAGGATYDWVDASPLSGKAGKTVVTFEVDENTDRGDVEAKFVFTCGDATAEYTIKSTEKEVVIPEIEVTSDNPVELGNEGSAFDVTLVTDTEGAELVAADFEAEISVDWLTFNAPATGDATSATLKFTAEANSEEGAPARSADITISYPGVENIVIKVNQAAGPEPQPAPEITIALNDGYTSPFEVEYTEKTQYYVQLRVSSSIVDMTANPATVPDLEVVSDQSWLVYGRNISAGRISDELTKINLYFNYDANPTDVARTANVTVSYKGTEYVKFQIVQAGDPNAGVEPPVGGDFVPYMKDHCISPELKIYTNASNKTMIESVAWANPSVLNVGKTMTVEMLVKHDEVFQKKGDATAKWDGTWVNCIFGMEGRFLVRQGDNSPAEPQQWELVWAASSDPTETKYRATEYLPGNEWVHLAIVADGSNVTLYQNGKSVGGGAIPSHVYNIDFSTSFDGYEQGQAFALGRAYDNARDFVGKMAEVRIWNRALSADEINADGHFYSVDPASNGLVAYWKLNEGEGDTFYDSTSNGNNLRGYYNTMAENPDSYSATGKIGLNYWDFGVDWTSEVPEVPSFPRN